MSDEEEGGFLSRWSRRKREARVQERRPAAEPATEGKDAAQPEEVAEPVDLSELPPVESLTAESDFSAFMRKGVPTDLKTAALRKLWLSDPAIREYKTLADYDWDFNAPGYGALLPTDDVKKLVDMVLRPRSTEPKPEVEPGSDAPPELAAPQVEASPAEALPVDTVRLTDPARPVPEPTHAEERNRIDRQLESERIGRADPSEGDRQIRKRRHGGAIPT